MSSSASSSSRGAGPPAALALALGLALGLGAGCRAARPLAEPPRPRRLALFPVQNLAGGAAPLKALGRAFREALERHGLELAPDEAVQRVLAARRVRHTGGLDHEVAAALREEAGIDAVVIVSLEAWLPATPPRVALTARLVTTAATPAIRWIEGAAAGGADAPGLLGLGLVPAIEALRDRAVERLASSLAADLAAHRPSAACPQQPARAPGRSYRSPLAADPQRRTVAVLPFVNDTRRRDAGEVVALRFLAPLVAAGTVEVVEPGEVRTEMLAYRLGAAGAISLDDARVLLELLHADLVLSGTVRTFEEASGSSGAPRVDLSAWVLDRRTGQLAWSSTTSAAGDDGVWLFGAGRVSTASALACAVAKGVVDPLLKGRSPLSGDAAAALAPPAPPEGSISPQ